MQPEHWILLVAFVAVLAIASWPKRADPICPKCGAPIAGSPWMPAECVCHLKPKPLETSPEWRELVACQVRDSVGDALAMKHALDSVVNNDWDNRRLVNAHAALFGLVGACVNDDEWRAIQDGATGYRGVWLVVRDKGEK